MMMRMTKSAVRLVLVSRLATTTTTTSPWTAAAMSMSTTTTTANSAKSHYMIRRTFQFVPYGQTAAIAVNSDSTTIACDGRVAGVSLELTHWNGNETPDNLYADTSTGMALRLARLSVDNNNKNNNKYQRFDNAIVLNNHYDSDGVLSVWACLEPVTALQYESLLIAGAEAGDFGEWSTDAGIKLDAILSALEQSDGPMTYQTVLNQLPDIVHDLTTTGGMAYHDLWKPVMDQVLQDWDDLQQGRVSLMRGPGRMVYVMESTSTSTLSSFALHRGLIQNGFGHDTTRILRINRQPADNTTDDTDPYRYRYRYELVGHGWVSKLVTRHVIPPADGSILAQQMNDGNNYGSGAGPWKAGGTSGLVSVCQTPQFIDMSVDRVCEQLQQFDVGCQAVE